MTDNFRGTIDAAGYHPPADAVVVWWRIGMGEIARVPLNSSVPWAGLGDDDGWIARYGGGDRNLIGASVYGMNQEGGGGAAGATLKTLLGRRGIDRWPTSQELWDFAIAHARGPAGMSPREAAAILGEPAPPSTKGQGWDPWFMDVPSRPTYQSWEDPPGVHRFNVHGSSTRPDRDAPPLTKPEPKPGPDPEPKPEPDPKPQPTDPECPGKLARALQDAEALRAEVSAAQAENARLAGELGEAANRLLDCQRERDRLGGEVDALKDKLARTEALVPVVVPPFVSGTLKMLSELSGLVNFGGQRKQRVQRLITWVQELSRRSA